MANKSGRRSLFTKLHLTVTTIKPVTVRSGLNFYNLNRLSEIAAAIDEIDPP